MRKLTKLLSFVLATALVFVTFSFNPIKAKASTGIDDFVTRCYSTALQRTPDAGGLNYWKDQLSNGKMVGSIVVYCFIFSDEYLNQNKTDTEFVSDLYTTFLGRTPDEAGYAFWCDKLQNESWTRETVFNGFANSDEFYALCSEYGITAGYYTCNYPWSTVNNVNLFVERFYKTCLNRFGDKDGQKFWVEGLLNGNLSGTACAKNFIMSPEYEGLDLTYEQYVENLYLAFMGRTYDESGKQVWLNALKYGDLTKDQVFAGFVNSDEFNEICKNYGIINEIYSPSDNIPDNYTETDSNGLRITYEYNENGQTLITQYEKDGDKLCETIYENGKELKTTYFYSDGTVSEYNESLYDSNGNLIRLNYYDNEGNLLNVTEYEYDANGNKIKEKKIISDGSVESYSDFEYFASGNKKRELEHAPNGRKYEFEYNEGGSIIAYTEYDENGVISSYTEFDGSVNTTKCIFYDGDGNVDSWCDYEYDAKGNLIKELYFDSDGNRYGCYAYAYDDNRCKTSEKELRSDDTVSKETEFYSNGKKMKETTFNEDGSTYSVEDYRNNGKLSNQSRFYDNGSKDVYEYDENEKQVSLVQYNSDGKITSTKESEYYASGVLKSTTINNSDGSASGAEYNENYIKTSDYTLTADGTRTICEYNIVDSTRKETVIDAIGCKTEINYDDRNRKTSMTTYWANGLKEKSIEYDEAENNVHEIIYKANGVDVQYYLLREYESHTWLLSEEKYNGNDELVYGYEYEYDGDGNITKETNTNSDGTKEVTTYDSFQQVNGVDYYNASGIRTFRDTFHSNGVRWKTYKYDSDGVRVILTTEYDDDGVTVKNTY